MQLERWLVVGRGGCGDEGPGAGDEVVELALGVASAAAVGGDRRDEGAAELGEGDGDAWLAVLGEADEGGDVAAHGVVAAAGLTLQAIRPRSSSVRTRVTVRRLSGIVTAGRSLYSGSLTINGTKRSRNVGSSFGSGTRSASTPLWSTQR